MEESTVVTPPRYVVSSTVLVGGSELQNGGEYSSHTSQICCLNFLIREPELTDAIA
jgi:hypothetical protein